MLQCHTRPFLYNFSVGRARKNGIGFVEWFLVLFWGYFPWYFNSSFLCDLFFRGFWCKFTTFNIMQETGQCIPSLSFAEFFFFALNIHIVYTRFFYETFEIYQYFIPLSESLVMTFLFCSIKAKRQVSNMTSNLIPYHRGTYFKIGFNGLLVTSALINETLDANFSRTKNPMELKTSKAVYFIFLDVPLPGKSSDFVGHAKSDFGIL